MNDGNLLRFFMQRSYMLSRTVCSLNLLGTRFSNFGYQLSYSQPKSLSSLVITCPCEEKSLTVLYFTKYYWGDEMKRIKWADMYGGDENS